MSESKQWNEMKRNETKRSNVRLEYVILWEQEKTELNWSFEQPDCCKKKTATMIRFGMSHGGRQWRKEQKQKIRE